MERKAVPTVAVTVNDAQWTRVVSFRNAGPNDAVYLLDPEDGTIRFGDGAQGRRPQVGDTISVSYRDGAGSTGKISKRIANASQIKKFWVVVGPSRQAVGWGKRPC